METSENNNDLAVLKDQLRTLARGAYEIQQNRISTGLRVLGAVKSKLGVDLAKKEKFTKKEINEILETVRNSHKLVTEAAVKLTNEGRIPFAKFKGNELISDYALYSLISNYIELERQEAREMKALVPIVTKFPIRQFLSTVNGCGPTMSAVIIAEFDPHKAKYVSSFWKYAGLDVGPDGKGRNKTKAHLVKTKYIDRNGKEQEKDSITFNPWLRAKLLYVLGGCMIKAKGGSVYTEMYYNYKKRMENHAVYGLEKKPGHRNRMAVRYMIKQFIKDLYNAWMPLEGLVVQPTYAEAKLGHLPHGHGQAGPRPVKPQRPDNDDEPSIEEEMMLDAEQQYEEDADK